VDIAMRMMQKEAEADNLNYFPLATFTKQGTVDMVKGLFTQERLGLSANSFGQNRNIQSTIETKLHEYIDNLQSKGITLPHFGPGKLSLDTRTGFFILPQVIPRALMIPLPADADAETQAQTQPYRYVTMPLETEEDRKRALNYMLIFRNHIPSRFMEKYGLDKGVGIRRAMVFDRPPVLPRIFDELGLEVPASFRNGIGRASALFQKNTARPKPVAAAAPAAATAAPAPAAVPLTKQDLEELAKKNIESFPAMPSFSATQTPYVPPASALVKQKSWLEELSNKKQRKTRKSKQFGGNKTRKQYVNKNINELAKMFKKVWSSHKL
jgi:hypothetical protein